MSSNFAHRIPTPNKCTLPYKHKNLWVGFWDNTLKEIQYGKLLETYNFDNESAKVFMTHYKVLSNITDVHITPHSRPRQLTPCNGKLDNCPHSRPYYGSSSKAHKCYILKELTHVLKVKISKSNQNNYLAHNYHTNRVAAYQDYIQLHSPIDRTHITLNLSKDNYFISSLIQGSQSVISRLNHIRSSIQHTKVLFFHTDGSLQPSNTIPEDRNTYMGLAWILSTTCNDNPTFNFNASTKFFASSTRAESFAILTALIICPKESTVNIYTDSLNAIRTYDNFLITSSRKNLKKNNMLVWHTIHHIVNTLNLKVRLHKIKAHTGIIFNDMADNLAKEASGSRNLAIEVNRHNRLIPITGLLWSNYLPVDQDVRKSINTIQRCQQLSNLLKHPSIKMVRQYTSKKHIDFFWTALWFKHSTYDIPTCHKASIDKGRKIKYLLSLLPTTDVLHRNYPKLIQPLQCFQCSAATESNLHLWRCRHSRQFLHNACSMLKTSIINIFKQHRPKSWKKVRDYILRMNIFDINVYNSSLLLETHPFLMLFHQLIPRCITDIFKIFKVGLAKYKFSLLESLQKVYQYLNTNIWIPRTVEFKNWKHIHNIRRKDFKNYYYNHPSHKSSDQSDQDKNPTNTRVRRKINIYNRLNSSRGPDDEDDWIIWVSSNFIHNRPLYKTFISV